MFINYKIIFRFWHNRTPFRIIAFYFSKNNNGILLYIQKDNLQTKWFNVSYEKEKADKILKRFNALHASLIENKIPEAEAKHNSDAKWMCEKCPWKKECWEREG